MTTVICKICRTQFESGRRNATNCPNCLKKIKKETGGKVYNFMRKFTMQRLGMACACCGESQYEKLSIDHKNGGGNQQKKSIRGIKYMKYLCALSNNELFENFQTLCYNCNTCNGFWGVCAHELHKM